MKKLLLAALTPFVCTTVLHAQEYEEKTITITPAITGGYGGTVDGYDEGPFFGGNIRGEYFASDFYRITLTAGYLNLKLSQGENVPLYPVLLGVKRHFSEPFYIGTGLGITKVGKGGGTAFTYNFNLGFIIRQQFDLSLEIQSARGGLDDALVLAGLRLGYRF